MASERGFRALSVGTLGYSLAVVVWGAYVRATGSGAGCGDHWPVCNGQVVPRAPSVQTMIEFTHRLTSGLALVAVVALALYARRVYAAGHPARRAANASLLFMVLEAAVGAGLVLLRLVALDASARRAVAMAVHLVNTFFLLAALTSAVYFAFTAPAASTPARTSGPRSAAQTLLGASAVGTIAVGVTGAIAALGDTLAQHSVGGSFAELLLQLRIAHPLVALGVLLLLFATASTAWAQAPRARALVAAWSGAFVLQALAGLVNVWLRAPVWMQLVHLLLADVVWITLVLVRLRVADTTGEGAREAAAVPAVAAAAG